MVRGRSAAAPNPTLQNVKWRFLSDAALGPTVRPQAYPDDSKKRISHLEKALASAHDLEAQYQSFCRRCPRSTHRAPRLMASVLAGRVSHRWAPQAAPVPSPPAVLTSFQATLQMSRTLTLVAASAALAASEWARSRRGAA